MHRLRLPVLTFIGLLAVGCSAVTITEDFSADPRLGGWRVFGDTNLFRWDSTNQNLAVTWDSSRSNSYFYLPLGTLLTRADDFCVEFDLQLHDLAGGVEPGTTGPLQIGLGFLQFTAAASPGFHRGEWGSAPNVVEFNYYPEGYFVDAGVIYEAPCTAPPALIPASGFLAAPTHPNYYNIELPTHQTIHVAMTFTTGNQTLTTSLTTNGVRVAFPAIVLTGTENSAFTAADDYQVDMFSISSYSSVGAYQSSVFGHGTVDNLAVTLPPPPVQNLAGMRTGNVWQCQFTSRTNWLYTLERTTDFQAWSNVSQTFPGTAGELLSLADSNSPDRRAFYRIRADRP
jgi:hypothetical protein